MKEIRGFRLYNHIQEGGVYPTEERRADMWFAVLSTLIIIGQRAFLFPDPSYPYTGQFDAGETYDYR